MRAALVKENPNGSNTLVIEEIPDPKAGAGEVIIKIAATALNRADLGQKAGVYPSPPGSPEHSGMECAGVIQSVGKGVTQWKARQRVMALLGGGGYAEQVVVPQETVMPVPDHVTLEEAAAIPEAWLTAYSNMVQIGRLSKGERVLIHAGASGVGTAAIQMAKWMGCTVYTTLSTAKVEPMQGIGADAVIDYKTQNFAEEIATLTNGKGVDVIIDFIGAPYWQGNLRALAEWGRLVLVGLMGGAKADIDLQLFLSKKITVSGSTLRYRTLAQKGKLVADFTRDILPAFEDGNLHPLLDPRRFTLDEINEAQDYMEANGNVGKIVVQIQNV